MTHSNGSDFLSAVSVAIYDEPQPQAVLAPAAITLMCRGDGQPVPDIVWIKKLDNGTTFEFTSSFDNVNITEIVNKPNKTSYLTIEPTSALDTANYSCRVENLVGFLTSGEAMITVYGKLDGNKINSDRAFTLL